MADYSNIPFGFVQFKDIKGEVKVGEHTDWIALEYTTIKIVNTSNSSTDVGSWGSGKAYLEPIPLLLSYDKAITTLQKFAANGTHIESANIHLLRNLGGTKAVKWIQYELSDVFIVEAQCGSPKEPTSIRVMCKKIKCTFTPADYKGKSQGDITWTWDLENQAIT
ncbi:type VI secretion system tube protein Hcp [Xenorhabdus sp. 12]|uniref:Type VI secretion system tube protein Hcp n=1 Tax=Xenorhabdus santafensis TaxID=2582833 RepID=A0ABU4S4K0_9GAMM|nr:type VI secretion system tube protein Hcp [Xenorhabdus sp. 12]MDX7985951.1 type VI secretion system tube protein Hcp [Xenorhabdus sp. 12]